MSWDPLAPSSSIDWNPDPQSTGPDTGLGDIVARLAALEALVASIEASGVPASVNYTNVTSALGYIPANKAGDTFGGDVTTAGSLLAHNSVFAGNYAGEYSVSLRAGDGGRTGYIDFHWPDSGRKGYIGYGDEAGGPLLLHSDDGGGFRAHGGPLTVGDGLFGLRFNGADGLLDFDAGDYFYYSRVGNTFSFNIGDASQLIVDGARIKVSNILQIGDTSLYVSLNGGVAPLINFDAADYFTFDRTNNIFSTVIAGAPIWQVTPIGGALSGVLQVSGHIEVGDTNYFAQIVSGKPQITFDTGGDALNYDRTGNSYNFYIGGVAKATLSAGGLSVAGAIYPAADTNFSLDVPSSVPTINFDAAGDTLTYDRTGNFYTFNIAASEALIVSYAYTFVHQVLYAGDTRFGLSNTNTLTPSLIFDNSGGNDNLTFTRATNTFAFNIGGVAKATLSATAFVVTATTTLAATSIDSATGLTVTNGGAGHGFVSLLPGSTTTTGSVVFLDTAGSQHSIIVGSNTGSLQFGSTNGQGFLFTGGKVQIYSGSGLNISLSSCPIYADNAAAIAGGLVSGDVYRTATGQLMIRY